jgi:hypothetical protein
MLLPREIYYNYGFSMREVLQCQECQKEEADSFNLVWSATPVTRDSEVFQSICETVRDLCLKNKNENQNNEGKENSSAAVVVVNYYDAMKQAFRKEKCKNFNQYNPTTIRNYLLDRGFKDINKIDKDLEVLWQFTFLLVNTKTEERIKVVNKDPDNLLISWIDS